MQSVHFRFAGRHALNQVVDGGHDGKRSHSCLQPVLCSFAFLFEGTFHCNISVFVVAVLLSTHAHTCLQKYIYYNSAYLQIDFHPSQNRHTHPSANSHFNYRQLFRSPSFMTCSKLFLLTQMNMIKLQ